MTLEAWLGASVIGLGRAGGRLQEGGGGRWRRWADSTDI